MSLNAAMKNLILTIVYFSIGILFLIAGDYRSFIPALVLKCMMMPALMIYFLSNSKGLRSKTVFTILSALVFSWAGDILLQAPRVFFDLFVPGLASFMFAHIMYISCFFGTPGKDYITGKGVIAVVPVAIYGLIFITFLYGNLGSMKLPVAAYTIVILLMVIAAINRKNKVNTPSFNLVLSGAILFVISDSILALRKFGHPFEGSSMLVIITYLIAQYLIVNGIIREKEQTQA